MIKAVIIDDNSNAVELLRILLQQYCTNVQVVGSTSQPHLAAKLINDLQPNLVFLDVKMPGLSGFDVLVQLQNHQQAFDVIFTTAYDEFAIKAIKFSAFDYLLKPINPIELTASIERLLSQRKLKPESSDKMIHFLENIQKENDNERSLALSGSTETIYIPLQNIIRLQAERNYTKLFFTNRSPFLSSKTLKEFDQLLNNNRFIRIHKSHLVNISFIQSYIKEGFIALKTGEKIEVSRRKKEFVTATLEGLAVN